MCNIKKNEIKKEVKVGIFLGYRRCYSVKVKTSNLLKMRQKF